MRSVCVFRGRHGFCSLWETLTHSGQEVVNSAVLPPCERHVDWCELMWLGDQLLKKGIYLLVLNMGQQGQSWKNPTGKLQGQQEFQKNNNNNKQTVRLAGVTCLRCPCLRIVKLCRWKLNRCEVISHRFREWHAELLSVGQVGNDRTCKTRHGP